MFCFSSRRAIYIKLLPLSLLGFVAPLVAFTTSELVLLSLPWYEPVAPADALSWEAWLAPALLLKHLIPLGSIFFVGSPETASQNLVMGIFFC